MTLLGERNDGVWEKSVDFFGYKLFSYGFAQLGRSLSSYVMDFTPGVEGFFFQNSFGRVGESPYCTSVNT